MSTISGGIVDPAAVADPNTFIWAMMAALIAWGLWLNLATWLGAPVLGGMFAAAFLAFIKVTINEVEDKIAAAWRWVPILIGIMAGAFSGYLIAKDFKKIVEVSLGQTFLLGLRPFLSPAPSYAVNPRG